MKLTSKNDVTTFLSPPSVSSQIENYRKAIIEIQNNDQFHPEKYEALQPLAVSIESLMTQYGMHQSYQAALATLQRQLVVAMRVYALNPDEALQDYRAEVQSAMAISEHPRQKEECLQRLEQEMSSFVRKYEHYIAHRDDIAALREQVSQAIDDCRQSTYPRS